MTIVLRADTGAAIPLDLGRWRAEPDPFEHEILEHLADPVLDVGCGPGRLVAALAAMGRPALGIDPSIEAIAEARRRGAAVLRRSVFDPLPGEGRWGAALLLDGNIGIGGDPALLLARVAGLLRPGGEVVVEVDGPGCPTDALRVQLDGGDGTASEWFPWARVSADDVTALLAEARFGPCDLQAVGGRWLARSRWS